MDRRIESLAKLAIDFRDERNWEKYHTGKDLSMCLSIEASEVLELFLWKGDDEIDIDRLKDEIGDVFYTLLLLTNRYKIDLADAMIDKIEKNKLKYPIEKFADSNRKYDE